MEFIEVILWFLVLIDSLVSNIIAWFYPKWYKKRFSNLSRHFPASKGWCFWYLALVLWIGFALFRIKN